MIRGGGEKSVGRRRRLLFCPGACCRHAAQQWSEAPWQWFDVALPLLLCWHWHWRRLLLLPRRHHPVLPCRCLLPWRRPPASGCCRCRYRVGTTSSILRMSRAASVARLTADVVTSSGCTTFSSSMSVVAPLRTLMPAAAAARDCGTVRSGSNREEA